MTSIFSAPNELITGLLTGIIFGFLLQKATVTKPAIIKKQLILKDFTVMKVILTAIATGGALLYIIKAFTNHREFIISVTTLKAALIGGGLFGIGMAMLGLCPGTCIGALAEKNKAAAIGFIGMIFGALLYKQSFGWITKHIKPSCEINTLTLSQYLNMSPWAVIAPICALVIIMIMYDRKNRKKT